MKKCMVVGFFVLVFLGWAGLVFGQYSGGDGSIGNPYKIRDVNDWQKLMDTSGDWRNCYILTEDIDMSGVNVTPVGDLTTEFTGVFDGNNHIISNVEINQPNSYLVGLFGNIGDGGRIRNLGVVDVNIIGNEYVGGLVGHNLGSLTDCYSSGSVSGIYDFIGGLVGYTWNSDITGCYANCSVSGNSCIGGLAGYNDYGYLSACYSTGAVSGTKYVGGLVGLNEGPLSVSLNACFASGSVNGKDDVGGLVGQNNSIITASFWDMESSGQATSASGRGLTTNQMKSINIFRNAGWADKGWVMQDGLDYPRLKWEGTEGLAIPEPLPVPLLGNGTSEDPYQIWTVDDFVESSCHVGILDSNIILMTNLDMNDLEFNPIGDIGQFGGVFDGNDNVISNVVMNRPNRSFIGLFSHVKPSGQICNLGVEEVNLTGYSYVGGVMAYSYNQIKNCYAVGSVNGKGRYVGGLLGRGSAINCYATCAVNGNLEVGGLIGDGFATNCYARGLVKGTIYVGGLLGQGCATNCYATGSVYGTDSVGGLVGTNICSTTNCYATGSIYGAEFSVGGLVGNNYDNLTDCYASGSVNGTTKVGGLAGDNSGCIYNSFSVSDVNGTGNYVGCLAGRNWLHISNSFWDIEKQSHGITQSIGCIGPDGTVTNVIGLTTSQMQQKATYTTAPADWDFVNVWGIGEGQSYPYLRGYLGSDINEDGRVDYRDLAELAREWLCD